MKSLELVVSYLEKIKDAKGRNKKIELLERLKKEDGDNGMDLFRKMLVWTYDFYRNFWIRSDPDYYKIYSTSKPMRDQDWEDFEKILTRLMNREVTGNAARKEVGVLFERVDRRTRYWFSQVLNRSLEVGLQMRSFEKFYPDLFPKISFMLAKDWNGKDLQGTWIFEPKLDGERMAAVFDEKQRPTAMSRTGRPKTNVEHIIEELKQYSPKCVVFDGELMGDSWGDVGASRGKKKSNKKKLKFFVFDFLTLTDWKNKSNKLYYKNRNESLRQYLSNGNKKYVQLLPQIVIENPTAAQILKLKKQFIAKGYEGLVAKRSMSLYLFKRDVDWTKIKFRESADLKVIDATEGNHKYKGVGVGALILEGKVGKVKVRTRTGQGLSDSYRKKFYTMWKAGKLKGLMVEVDHYGITDQIRSNTSSQLPALRNCIFKRVRLDKTER